MVADERIQDETRRIGSRVFSLWYYLLMASLLYRQFYLRQSLDQYWDIALIFFLGALYASIARFARGAVSGNTITRSFKWAAPIIILTIIITTYLLGNINSTVGLIETIVGASIGLVVVGSLFLFLYRRWEQRIDVS